MSKLHVNVDHIATVRQARRTVEPSPLEAVKLLEGTGVAGITIHLREDRRHINDVDVREIDSYLRESQMGLTFEMGATEKIRERCLETRAKLATIVPEKRTELTTEGGLNLSRKTKYLAEFIKPIQANGTKISFFIDPEIKQIDLARKLGAEFVELHTGTYANLFIEHLPHLASERIAINLQEQVPKLNAGDLPQLVFKEYERLRVAAIYAQSIGLKTNLGHGLTLCNLGPILSIPDISELHIGHSIIANAAYNGLRQEVIKYTELIQAHHNYA